MITRTHIESFRLLAEAMFGTLKSAGFRSKKEAKQKKQGASAPNLSLLTIVAVFATAGAGAFVIGRLTPKGGHNSSQALTVKSNLGEKSTEFETKALEVAQGSPLYELFLRRAGLLGKGYPNPYMPRTLSTCSGQWRKAVEAYAGARTPGDYRKLKEILREPDLRAPNAAEEMTLRGAVAIERFKDEEAASLFTSAAAKSDGLPIRPYLLLAAAEASLKESPQSTLVLATQAEALLPGESASNAHIVMTKATAEFVLDPTPAKAVALKGSYDVLRNHPDTDLRTLVQLSYDAVAALDRKGRHVEAEALATTNIKIAETLPEAMYIKARLTQVRGVVRHKFAYERTSSLMKDTLRSAAKDSRDAFFAFMAIDGAEGLACNAFVDYAASALSLHEPQARVEYANLRAEFFDPLYARVEPTLDLNDKLRPQVREMNSKDYRSIGKLTKALEEAEASIQGYKSIPECQGDLEAERQIRSQILKNLKGS